MGVRGLQTYLESSCPFASQFVSIQDLLKRTKDPNSRSTPIIVVDGSSCIRILYKDLEWIGGGQMKQFGERAKEFVDTFKRIGVELVFFFDGPTECRKRRTWVKRRMDSMKSVYHVLDGISSGKKSYEFDRSSYFLLPPGMGQLCRIIFELICGCKVYQALTECDDEIAEYARTHGAFAILSQDSDFVILNTGVAFYLSMENLHLQTLRTRHYNQSALADSLGIEVSQLPLLATLVGNDIIPNEQLRKFHNDIQRRYSGGGLIPKLGQYIRSLPRDGRNIILDKMSQRIFGHDGRQQDILTSISSYGPITRDFEKEDRDSSNSKNWVELLCDARDKHTRNKIPGMIYAIMKGLPFESSTIVEDYRQTDLPVFATVTQPIRQRLYGLLLQEKPLPPGQKEHSVEEWCMAGPRSLDKANYIVAIPPEHSHPGLKALWGRNAMWKKSRWELFVHSVSPDLDVEQLQNLPPHMVIPTAILFFLHDYLKPWEIDVMLATAACMRLYDNVRLAGIPADPLIPRGVRLSSLLMRTTFILYILLAACGYPLSIKETAPWHFFDGKLFQSKYRAAEGGRLSQLQLCEKRDDILEHFQMARNVIYDNIEGHE